MHVLKRISVTPRTPLQIGVDAPAGDGDGGFLMGGTFWFAPAGEDGDTVQVSTHVARAIMSDPSLAKHFTCDPPVQPDGASGDQGGAVAARPAPIRERRAIRREATATARPADTSP